MIYYFFFNSVYCQIFVKSEGMFLLSNENLSPNETDSGDMEIIRSTLVVSGEGLRVGLANQPWPLCRPQAQTLQSLQSAACFTPSLSAP